MLCQTSREIWHLTPVTYTLSVVKDLTQRSDTKLDELKNKHSHMAALFPLSAASSRESFSISSSSLPPALEISSEASSTPAPPRTE